MSRTQGQGSATRQPASTTTRRLTAAAARFAALLVVAGVAAATGLGMLAGPLAGPLVAPAGAHARLDGSHPSNGQELEHLPHHVSITLDAKPATLEGDPLAVYAPGGERIDTGQPWLEDDHETIGILLDPETAGPKGDYELLYRVVSTDNHVISGRVAFTTTAAGPPEAGSTPEGAETESGEAPAAGGSGSGPGDGEAAGDSSPVTQPAGVATTIAPDDPHAEHLAASQPSEPSEAVDDARPFMHGFDSDIRPRLAAVAIIVLLAVGVARRAVRRDGREPRGFAPGEARGGPSGPSSGRSGSSPSSGLASGSPSGSSGMSGRRSGAAGGFGGARRGATGPTTTGPVPAFRAGGGSHDLAAGWGDDPGPDPDARGERRAPYEDAPGDPTYGRPVDEPTPADAAAARAGDLWSSLTDDGSRDAELAAGLARFDAADGRDGHDRARPPAHDGWDEVAEAADFDDLRSRSDARPRRPRPGRCRPRGCRRPTRRRPRRPRAPDLQLGAVGAGQRPGLRPPPPGRRSRASGAAGTRGGRARRPARPAPGRRPGHAAGRGEPGAGVGVRGLLDGGRPEAHLPGRAPRRGPPDAAQGHARRP